MAVAFQIDNASCLDMLNALVDKLDVGDTAPAVRIFSEAKPANCEAADASASPLVEITLDGTAAFGNATDDAPGAVAAVTGTPSNATAAATGTAVHWRAYSVNSGTYTCRMQGTCGTSNADFVLSPGTTITINEPVTILTWNVRLGEGG